MSEMLSRLVELSKALKPLPRHTLFVERLDMLDSLPRVDAARPLSLLGGIPVQVDATLLSGVWELRDEAGAVLSTNARPVEAA